MAANDALTGQAARFIFETFRVSQAEANDLGSGYVSLIGANGGDPTKFSFEDLRLLIIRRMAETHEWRDESERGKAALEQQKTTRAYQDFIEKARPSPFKKW